MSEEVKIPEGWKMTPEEYVEQIEYAMKKKYNDETVAEIKRRARSLLYRTDFDLFVVINWIIDNIEDSMTVVSKPSEESP